LALRRAQGRAEDASMGGGEAVSARRHRAFDRALSATVVERRARAFLQHSQAR